MKKNHAAVELKRVLDERIQEANSPNAVWIGHDEVFDELEARYAD